GPSREARMAVTYPHGRLPITTPSHELSAIVGPPWHGGQKAVASSDSSGSDIEDQPLRILDAFLEPHQESHRLAPIDEAMVVAHGDVHHRPDLDLVADGHGAVLDLVHAENARLRRVQDRHGHQRAIDAAVRDC